MTLHHTLSGPDDAPVLLLGASLGTNVRMWEAQLSLAQSFRLLRFDHRGHGQSPAPPGPYELADLAGDVLELMDSLGIARASLCGLSLGGMVGMWLGAHAPERIERLVLLCTAAHMPPASGLARASRRGPRRRLHRAGRRRGGRGLAHPRLRRRSAAGAR